MFALLRPKKKNTYTYCPALHDHIFHEHGGEDLTVHAYLKTKCVDILHEDDALVFVPGTIQYNKNLTHTMGRIISTCISKFRNFCPLSGYRTGTGWIHYR